MKPRHTTESGKSLKAIICVAGIGNALCHVGGGSVSLQSAVTFTDLNARFV